MLNVQYPRFNQQQISNYKNNKNYSIIDKKLSNSIKQNNLGQIEKYLNKVNINVLNGHQKKLLKKVLDYIIKNSLKINPEIVKLLDQKY